MRDERVRSLGKSVQIYVAEDKPPQAGRYPPIYGSWRVFMGGSRTSPYHASVIFAKPLVLSRL